MFKHHQSYFMGEESFQLEDGIKGSYYVPDLGSPNIEFAPQYEFLTEIALMFGYNLEFKKQYDLSDYKSRLIKQSFKRADTLKNFVSFRQDISGGLVKEIKERKALDNHNYLETCSKSASHFMNNLINSNEDKDSYENYKEFEALSIKDFPWGNDKLIDDHFENINLVDGVKLNQSSEWSSEWMTYAQWYLAENLFGSYTELFKYKTKDKKEQGLIKAIIMKRIYAIVDYIKYFPISPAIDNNFSESRWNYIFQEIVDYNMIVSCKEKAKITNEFIIKEEITKCDGFDAISAIESCYGMLKVINMRQYYWSMKTFLNQMGLEGLIGWRI